MYCKPIMPGLWHRDACQSGAREPEPRAHNALATAGESVSCWLQRESRLKEEVWMGSMRRVAKSSVSTGSKCCWSAEPLGTEGRGHSLLDPSTATSSPLHPAVTHLERGQCAVQ